MKYGKSVKHILENEKFSPAEQRKKLTSGKVLKRYRELQGISQIELAEKTGLKQATISALENDRISLGVERAKTLARALKIHPSILAFPDWEHESFVA